MTDLDKAREEWLGYSRDTMCIPAYILTDLECGERNAIALVRPYIAALEAEVERLKVCGNCGHWSDFDLCAVGGHDNFMGNDHCHFTPSRWQEREA